MPQLDVSSYSSQIVWLVIFFTLLYFFISKILIPRLDKTIKERTLLLSSTRSDADHTKMEIDRRIEKISSVVDDAQSAARSIVEEAGAIISSMKSEALEMFIIKSREIYSRNEDFLKNFKMKSEDELKRMAFDVALQYCACILHGVLKHKIVDFNSLRNLTSEEIKKII